MFFCKIEVNNMMFKAIAVSVLSLVIMACESESPATQAEIVKEKSATEKPVASEIKEVSKYTAEVVPEKMTVQEKKERFRQLILPAVKKVFSELNQQYEQTKVLLKTNDNPDHITKLKAAYKAVSDEDLLLRLKPHPVSIVLAQAAMESAWATSRFFKEAKNIFGVWSFDKSEARIAAGEKRGKKTIWLKKYSTIEAAIRDNYRVLARGSAFSKFRKLRMKSSDPYKLVKGLDKYSELGARYGKELAAVIRYNKFQQFDL